MRPNKMLIPQRGDIVCQDGKITWGEPLINAHKKGPY